MGCCAKALGSIATCIWRQHGFQRQLRLHFHCQQHRAADPCALGESKALASSTRLSARFNFTHPVDRALFFLTIILLVCHASDPTRGDSLARRAGPYCYGSIMACVPWSPSHRMLANHSRDLEIWVSFQTPVVKGGSDILGQPCLDRVYALEQRCCSDLCVRSSLVSPS